MDQKLSQLIEELTTSGEPQLNPEKMKELKKICKSSEEQLSHAYRLLMTQLNQEHAEIRLSAFQIVDELFARSHQFRMLVISDFQEFLELTLGTDHGQPLPPPREVAQRLKQAAIQAVEGWNEKFGEAYKKLALGYHFLRHNKKVDFQDVNARTLAERKREEEKQKHLNKIYQERAKQAEKEMEEMSEEIESCLTEVENCFRLLVPFDFGPSVEAEFLDMAPGKSSEGVPCSSSPGWPAHHQSGLPEPQDEEQPCCSRDLPTSAQYPGAARGGASPPQTAVESSSEDEDEDSNQEEFVRRHGLGSHKYTLDVELSSDALKVQENEDNLAIVHAVRDALKLVRNKYLPAVCSWVQRFTRTGTHGGHLKHAIDLKVKLELALKKYKELDLEPEGGHRTEALADGEDEDDEDFVEVPEKEGYEAHIPDHLRPEYGLEPETQQQTVEKDTASQSLQAKKRMKRDEEALDPTSAAAQLEWLRKHVHPPPSASSSKAPLEPAEAQKLAAERARAPIIPFGVDLCYWGQEQPVAGKILKSDSQHRFWKPSEVEEEVDNADVSEMLRSRHITFAGKFEPVQHRCRARRPDGRLCERQDRLKIQEGRWSCLPLPCSSLDPPTLDGCVITSAPSMGRSSQGMTRDGPLIRRTRHGSRCNSCRGALTGRIPSF
ncbi:UV-stimulated scaffold protein A isoform X2 [Tupaia chinensis]|uniref:UV-stimulated scaffold protein A isoform X2 n=1 Tax=Tupaia chinensis TaxID=246437 RepID=UPI0007046AD6|nr:UV-stimulated scaffold protein A isoform X2 [Tupaia chinensis]